MRRASTCAAAVWSLDVLKGAIGRHIAEECLFCHWGLSSRKRQREVSGYRPGEDCQGTKVIGPEPVVIEHQVGDSGK